MLSTTRKILFLSNTGAHKSILKGGLSQKQNVALEKDTVTVFLTDNKIKIKNPTDESEDLLVCRINNPSLINLSSIIL